AAPRGPAPCARRARSARRTPRYRAAGSRAATLACWLARRPWTAPPLDRGGAETLQPAPYLDPAVVGLVYHARNFAARLRWTGIEVPPSMGLATAINFQPTGGGKAAITGDFVLIGDEVNPRDPCPARQRHRHHGRP